MTDVTTFSPPLRGRWRANRYRPNPLAPLGMGGTWEAPALVLGLVAPGLPYRLEWSFLALLMGPNRLVVVCPVAELELDLEGRTDAQT